MNKKIIFIPTLLLLTSFNNGDFIELERFVNARSKANFQHYSKNVSAILSKGTTGKILENQKMPSGNYGLKLEIQDGPYKGKTFWVYYNLKDPAMKLVNQKSQAVNVPELADEAVTTRAIKVIPDPEKSEVDHLISTVTNTSARSLNEIQIAQYPCKNAEGKIIYGPNPDDLHINYDGTNSITPKKEIAESDLHSLTCSGVEINYCKSDDGKIEEITLINHGNNPIVPFQKEYINRTFSFEFPDQARSDMHLLIEDSIDDTTSHVNYSVMMFLPRKVLPSAKISGDQIEVTLPNNEKFLMNKKTREIISGVLSEGPIKKASNGKTAPAAVNYTGEGVLIRADKNGDLPFGDIEHNNGTHSPSISTATISKKGFKDCKIPSKEIWYTDYNKKDNVLIKPELSTDLKMNEFVIKRCGFSIY